MVDLRTIAHLVNSLYLHNPPYPSLCRYTNTFECINEATTVNWMSDSGHWLNVEGQCYNTGEAAANMGFYAPHVVGATDRFKHGSTVSV